MPQYHEVVPALRWRARLLKEPITSEGLTEALSVEGLKGVPIPVGIWPAVRAFRKFRQEQRKHAADQFLRSRHVRKRK